MQHSEFTSKYHWMNGLDEYFSRNTDVVHDAPQKERWADIYKALYQDNWYRKRDVMIELANMPNSNPVHVKSWMNVLLKEHLDVDLKPQLVATLLRKYMKEDPLLVSLVQFIHYWSDDGVVAADMPDIGDFLSRGQVKSKLWLVDELQKVVPDGKLGNVVFYGGWYNFVAHFLFQNFDIDKIYSIDVDDKCIDPSKRLYPEETATERFIPLLSNVNDVHWEDDKVLHIYDPIKRGNMITAWKKDNEAKIKQFELIAILKRSHSNLASL